MKYLPFVIETKMCGGGGSEGVWPVSVIIYRSIILPLTVQLHANSSSFGRGALAVLQKNGPQTASL